MCFNLIEERRAPREWAAMAGEDVRSKEAGANQMTSASDSADKGPATSALLQDPSPSGAVVSPTAVHDNPLLRPQKRRKAAPTRALEVVPLSKVNPSDVPTKQQTTLLMLELPTASPLAPVADNS